MAHSHCKGSGLGTIGLYFVPLTVHTVQGQGTGQGMDRGPMGCMPISPFPVPVSVPYSVYEPQMDLLAVY